jgi:LysM repeat protein
MNIINNMNEEKTYHIDVTPEEDALFNSDVKSKNKTHKQPLSFTKVVCVVAAVHAVIGAGVLSMTNSAHAKPKDDIDLTQPVAEIPKQYQEPTPTPSPTPSPTPIKITQKITSVTTLQSKTNDKYIKEYVVKQGDTLYSISKKYKLNTERLIKINNIKDTNKLVVGQKLKFL